MLISGLEIIQNALAQFSAWSPPDLNGEAAGGIDEIEDDQISPEQIDHYEQLITAKLEELALSQRMVPGVTIVERTLNAGKATYLIGETANADERVGAIPHDMRMFTVIDGVTEYSGAKVPDDVAWRQLLESASRSNRQRGRPRYVYTPGPGQVDGARQFIFFPTPDRDYGARLFLRVPAVTSIRADHQYDLIQGAAQFLILQSAAALAPVFGVDPDTRSAVEIRASMGLKGFERRNNQYNKRVARLPRRWTARITGRRGRLRGTVYGSFD